MLCEGKGRDWSSSAIRSTVCGHWSDSSSRSFPHLSFFAAVTRPALHLRRFSSFQTKTRAYRIEKHQRAHVCHNLVYFPCLSSLNLILLHVCRLFAFFRRHLESRACRSVALHPLCQRKGSRSHRFTAHHKLDRNMQLAKCHIFFRSATPNGKGHNLHASSQKHSEEDLLKVIFGRAA